MALGGVAGRVVGPVVPVLVAERAENPANLT